MSHRDGHPMYGSARARWMAELEDLINMQRTDTSLTEAAARRTYGDDFKPRPDEGDKQLAGGDIKYEVHNHLPGPEPVPIPGPVGPARRPKSAAALLGAALILSLAVVGAAWLLSPHPPVLPHPMPTRPVVTMPMPTATPTSDTPGYNISIFEP